MKTAGRKIDDEHLKGFTSPKKGTKFDAKLSYDTQNKRISFVYEQSK